MIVRASGTGRHRDKRPVRRSVEQALASAESRIRAQPTIAQHRRGIGNDSCDDESIARRICLHPRSVLLARLIDQINDRSPEPYSSMVLCRADQSARSSSGEDEIFRASGFGRAAGRVGRQFPRVPAGPSPQRISLSHPPAFVSSSRGGFLITPGGISPPAS